MLEHGGALNAAARRWGRPAADWLDLSTGINPQTYPLPPIPKDCWQRLPQDDDGLLDIARAYYGGPHLLPVAGSQAAIQALPRLFPPGPVLMPTPLYAEHAAAWRKAGHEVRPWPCLDDTGHAATESLLDHLADCRHVLLCQPNNPTGLYFETSFLLDLAQRLKARGGCLIADEAFMDATPEDSLAGATGEPGLVVLRSLGKFFGLAGARVGFVLAWPALLTALATELGPWTVAGPSRWVARHALADQAWQTAQRHHLAQAGTRLARLLQSHLGASSGCGLFQWLRHPQAPAIHEALAQRGILVRLFADPASLRFGLPDAEAGWSRLDTALKEIGASF